MLKVELVPYDGWVSVLTGCCEGHPRRLDLGTRNSSRPQVWKTNTGWWCSPVTCLGPESWGLIALRVKPVSSP